MSLEEYRRKRDFGTTSEPTGELSGGGEAGKIYVIQRHDASHLHYDLRLEMNGVLKSWAIPKEPPQAKGLKRLAVQTEDHPLEYVEFEGVIPQGEYGAGKVETWDSGHYESLEIGEDKLVIIINGRRLRGEYCLIKMRPKVDKKNWLFFKK